MGKQPICVPLGVPQDSQLDYKRNFPLITRAGSSLMGCAGDQKAGRFNEVFHGHGVHSGDRYPERLCRNATASGTGGFATYLGFLVYNGRDYPKIHVGGASGNATGDMHWHSPDDAIRIPDTIVTSSRADSRTVPCMYGGLPV